MSHVFRRLAIAVVLTGAGAVALAPVAAQQPSAKDTISVPYTMFKLPNGLTVILHEDHSVPVVSVNVWYRAGSAHEKPGRTGFAHLFEHLMFEGSKNVAEGQFDILLEAAGGENNASTNYDQTNYYINVPSNSLDLALYLESDRMGYLLDVVSEQLVNGQRDVVKNERRQNENTPYGRASLRIPELMYPKNHPYHWPVLGYMEDLTAASAEDVREFFRKYYAPQNASLVVAGDIDPVETRKKIELWFSDVPRGKEADKIDAAAPPKMTKVIRDQMTDQVQLPRLYLVWHSPGLYKPGDAALDAVGSILSGGKNSRLYKRLVYDMQIAQSVSAFQASNQLGSLFYIIITARPSTDPPEKVLERLKMVTDEELEKLRAQSPTDREMQRFLNQTEASFFSRMESVGGFGGKADQLNGYFVNTGDPDYFAEDIARYRALKAADIQAAVRDWLTANGRLEFSVLPEAKGGK